MCWHWGCRPHLKRPSLSAFSSFGVTLPIPWLSFCKNRRRIRFANFPKTILFLVDTGFWLLSERAVNVLLDRCGWDKAAQTFPGNRPLPYDLYASFGPALGTHPGHSDPAIAALSAVALPLAESEFYHLGTGRQMIESVSRLQNRQMEQAGWGGLRPHPGQFVLNAVFDPPIRQAANHTLWVENSVIPASWQLAQEHILTGVPDNDWNLKLEPRVCLDFVPVGDRDFCVRVYGLDDPFRGAVSDPKTLWLGQSASLWMERRGLHWEDAGITPETDLYEAPLFPCLPPSRLSGALIEWLFSEHPKPNRKYAMLWRENTRLSAKDLNSEANVSRLFRQREENLRRVLPLMHSRPGRSAFFELDLAATARLMARAEIALPPALPEGAVPPLTRMQDSMLRAHLSRLHGFAEAEAQEEQAFGWLRNTFLSTRSLASFCRDGTF